MRISSSDEAEIIRLYFVEKWKIGSIASFLKRHHSSIARVIKNHELNLPIENKIKKKSILDDYNVFILQTLEKYPNISGSRVFQMLKERGYTGRTPGLVCLRLSKLRVKKKKEAYLRLKTLIAEEGQVDWADFGKIKIGKAERRLSAFVLTLSHSRMIFVRFFYSQSMREFLQGFVEAFEFFGGVPRKILLDNLKSGVTDRAGPFIHYNEQFLSLSKHYHFEPCAVGIRKGNEKGRVERSIQYVRSSFFSGREFQNIHELNKQAIHWTRETAAKRLWPSDPSKKVEDIFKEENSKLIPLPNNPFLAYDKKMVSIGKTPYARYDLNDYSVPAEYVMQKLQVVASEDYIEFYDGPNKVASHERSYSRQEIIEKSEHIDKIIENKKRAKKGTALHKILSLVPDVQYFLEILANRGENTGSAVNSLIKMIDTYGANLLSQAIEKVIVQESPKLKSLYFTLNRLRSAKSDLNKNLSAIEIKSEKFSNIFVNHHSASYYDKITGVKKP